MSTNAGLGPDGELDASVRELLLLMPRIMGRVKRLPVPPELRTMELTPRHLSLLSLLLFDGAMTVNELAARLGVAPTTVSLMVGDMSRKGILTRHENDSDRRRRIIGIADAHRPAIETWLAPGAHAWRRALAPLTPAQRRLFVDTLLAYHRETEQV
ncbi:MarR family winged helix-turn-helix transcriptional regulator [Nocardia sp. alder85J]|uniref:MarR family winged helix-turn-helix transcriptional regulator n=1 Tax=Nocardia sp. alder85J TaxID=2862949 RepID=UPI001CD4BCA1|nr:MarR family winged helix-turn-helix transcriptional regulator [Nocardia sp. alder85J]MCX4090977.1 MarR family winged helix-turn-helix transcriptional regulator [Nocardia sp. alder85J]